MYLRFSFLYSIGMAWTPGIVYAAAVMSDPTGPLVVPVALAIATFFFSTLMGLTTLAIRVLGELQKDPDKTLPKAWLYVAAHMLGSWSAGALAFITCMGIGSDVWKLLGTVMVFSFTGAKVFEKASEQMKFGSP